MADHKVPDDLANKSPPRLPYRAIPTPGTDGLNHTVDALKENVEMLIGLRGERGGSNQVFTNAKDKPPIGSRNGDLWAVRDSDGSAWTFRVWFNGKWT